MIQCIVSVLTYRTLSVVNFTRSRFCSSEGVNLAIICGVLRPSAGSLLQHFAEFCRELAISFHHGTTYLWGLKPPTPFSGQLKIVIAD